MTQRISLKSFTRLINTQYATDLITVLDLKTSTLLNEIEIRMIPPAIRKLNINWHSRLSDTPLSILPRSIQEILFYDLSRQLIENDELPNQLKSLSIIKWSRNVLTDNSVLPNTLTHLSVPFVSNFLFPLPSNLTSLVLSSNTPKPIPNNCLPNSLKYLKFDNARADYIEKIPMNEHIQLNYCCASAMNQNDLAIYQSFKWISHLVLGFGHEELTPGILPSNLKSLLLPAVSLTPGLLPDQLEILNAPHLETQLQEGVLPSSLLELSISSYKKELTKNILPSKLTSLSIAQISYPKDYPFIQEIIPKTLKKLIMFSEIKQHFLSPVSIGGTMETIITPNLNPLLAPASLKTLELNLHQYGTIGLPNTKNILDVREFVIPPSIENFILRGSVSSVSFNGYFIPSTVKTVGIYGTIGLKPGFIKEGCKYLTIANRHSLSSLKKDDLPKSITHLKIHYDICDYIPDHIKVLDLSNKPKKMFIDKDNLKNLTIFKMNGVLYDFNDQNIN